MVPIDLPEPSRYAAAIAVVVGLPARLQPSFSSARPHGESVTPSVTGTPRGTELPGHGGTFQSMLEEFNAAEIRRAHV